MVPHINPQLWLQLAARHPARCLQQGELQKGGSHRAYPATLKLHVELLAMQGTHVLSEHLLLFSCSLKAMREDKALWSGCATPDSTLPNYNWKTCSRAGWSSGTPQKLIFFTALEATSQSNTSSRHFLITEGFWQRAGWEGSAHRSSWASVIRILPRAKLDLQRETDHLEG